MAFADISSSEGEEVLRAWEKLPSSRCGMWKSKRMCWGRYGPVAVWAQWLRFEWTLRASFLSGRVCSAHLRLWGSKNLTPLILKASQGERALSGIGPYRQFTTWLSGLPQALSWLRRRKLIIAQGCRGRMPACLCWFRSPSVLPIPSPLPSTVPASPMRLLYLCYRRVGVICFLAFSSSGKENKILFQNHNLKSVLPVSPGWSMG